MINLRTVYKRAEEHTTLAVCGLFLALAFLIVLQSIFSPALVLAGVLGVTLVVTAFVRPHFVLAFLSVYLPFESIILKFVPDDVYVLTRYGSEFLIYLLAFVVIVRLLSGKRTYQKTPFDLPFVLFVAVLLFSALINFVPPTTALLGLRQILRFVLVFFLVVQLAPSQSFVKKLTFAMFGIVIFQSVLGIAQSMVGESLDQFLLPSEARMFGTLALFGGVDQFWDPGSRIFGTLGRYDRLGNFFYIFLAIATAILFTKKLYKQYPWVMWLFVVTVPALVLTYSRASWFAFLLGFLFIGVIVKKDRRVVLGFAAFVVFMMTVLAGSGLNVSMITEASGQSLNERFFETFSYARWRGEYYGLGRVFWFVHTPLNVVSASPIWGFGPGQFGGGAVTALGNTTVYEKLGLPFGVFGTLGSIDNNWFSLWGESGTLGMVFYLWFYLGLFVYMLNVARTHKDPFVQALALSVCAMLIGVGFNAFLSPVLEIRTTAFYVWMYAGFVYVLSGSLKNSRA